MLLNSKAWGGIALFVAAFTLCGCGNPDEPTGSQSEAAADVASALPSVSSEEIEELQRLASDAAAMESPNPSDAPAAN